MTRFIKTTVLGRILFLVPIVIFFAVIGKALELSNLIATPLAERLPVDSVGDFAIAHVLGMDILIAVCFIAGLVARTTVAKNLVTALETSVLNKIPAYELLIDEKARQGVRRTLSAGRCQRPNQSMKEENQGKA